MAYDPGAIDAALAAAVGDEPALIAELRGAFLDGVTRACTQLEAAETVEHWRMAAARLRGLSASFGAVRVLSDADLKGYDPRLHAVLAEVYAGHQAAGDLFWQHPDRVPKGPIPEYTAEVC